MDLADAAATPSFPALLALFIAACAFLRAREDPAAASSAAGITEAPALLEVAAAEAPSLEAAACALAAELATCAVKPTSPPRFG